MVASDLEPVEEVRPHGADGTANLLVCGDNLVAMSALREQLAGQIDLVYIDPPFFTGLSYYSQTGVGAGKGKVTRRAYRDNRARGMAGYLDVLHVRLWALRELLSDEGKLFVHCDWRANSMLRIVLDELFGPDCLRNEIVWRRAPNLGRQAASKQLGRTVDTIFVYSKTPGSTFAGSVPKRRTAAPLDSKGKPKSARWDEQAQAYFTTAPRGDYTDKSIAALRQQNRVYDSPTGTVYIKYFLTKGADGRWYKEQPVDTLWDDYEVRPLRHRPKREEQGYDTQKPEGLLERIIGWATQPGDCVLDVYGGSGTTAAVAEAMGRRWVACDIGATAVSIHRRRLLDLAERQTVAPIDLLSVEGAERRQWARDIDDVAAVLRAFGAEPDHGRWGLREGLPTYVGGVDEVMTDHRVAALCREVGAEAVVVLASIPMEICRLRKKRKLIFPVRAEIGLELEPTEDARTLRVCLTDVQCGADDDLDWAERVDGWAVDLSGGAVFRATWRSYRSHGDRALQLAAPAHRFSRGEHRVRVEVTTIYGDVIERTLRVTS